MSLAVDGAATALERGWSGALDVVEDVEGWLAREEAALLMDLAAAVPTGQVVVELGNYRGRSTVALALGSRAGAGVQVYSVDPHAEFTGLRGGHFGRADQAHLYANLARTGVGTLVSVVGLDSTRAAAAWGGARIGLLFVDGDHRYEAVRADWEAWRPHLTAGARVAFDDCDFEDVARLVAERCALGELALRARAGKVAVYSLR
jgi:predicted O-methyltransferase YrrM